MTLWATSDLHAGHPANRAAIEALPSHGGDWLLLAGDAAESPERFAWVLQQLTRRFAQVLWTPGNHELWTARDRTAETRGVQHYERLVATCRELGVLTPEDPYAEWPGSGPRTVVAPVFVLYDYSFAPDHVRPEQAVAWAAETGIRCVDEDLLSPAPYASRAQWCHARVALTEERLAAVPADARIVLLNHFPLRRDLAVLPRIPRFSVWCGTRATEHWTSTYPIHTVVYGHLHIRSSRVIDGVRHEEVSLGYPRQWRQERGLRFYLRRILP